MPFFFRFPFGDFLYRNDTKLSQGVKAADFSLQGFDTYCGSTPDEVRMRIVEGTLGGARQRFIILINNAGGEILMNSTDVLAGSGFVARSSIVDMDEIAYEIDFSCLDLYRADTGASKMRIKNAVYDGRVTVTITLLDNGNEVFYTNGGTQSEQLIQHIGPVLVFSPLPSQSPNIANAGFHLASSSLSFQPRASGARMFPTGEFKTWGELGHIIRGNSFDIEWTVDDQIIQRYLNNTGAPAWLRIISGNYIEGGIWKQCLMAVFLDDNGNEMPYTDVDGQKKVIEHIGPR